MYIYNYIPATKIKTNICAPFYPKGLCKILREPEAINLIDFTVPLRLNSVRINVLYCCAYNFVKIGTLNNKT